MKNWYPDAARMKNNFFLLEIEFFKLTIRHCLVFSIIFFNVAFSNNLSSQTIGSGVGIPNISSVSINPSNSYVLTVVGNINIDVINFNNNLIV